MFGIFLPPDVSFYVEIYPKVWGTKKLSWKKKWKKKYEKCFRCEIQFKCISSWWLLWQGFSREFITFVFHLLTLMWPNTNENIRDRGKDEGETEIKKTLRLVRMVSRCTRYKSWKPQNYDVKSTKSKTMEIKFPGNTAWRKRKKAFCLGQTRLKRKVDILWWPGKLMTVDDVTFQKDELIACPSLHRIFITLRSITIVLAIVQVST